MQDLGQDLASFHRPLRAALLVLCLMAGSGEVLAKPPHTEDIVGAIAFLLPVRDRSCPRMSFDPLEMSKMIDPRGLPLAEIKRRYAKDFQQSSQEAASRIAAEGLPAYCGFIRSFFGKTPGEFPGLVLH